MNFLEEKIKKDGVVKENCVAVVFLATVILNLVLPKNMDAAPQVTDGEKQKS